MPSYEGRQVAREFRERSSTHDPEAVDASTLRSADAVEIQYRPGTSLKTVRGEQPRRPYDLLVEKQGVTGLVFGGDPRYEFRPLVDDDQDHSQALRALSRQPTTLASAEDIERITTIEYPSRVPVAGAVQEDVDVTIYYRSPQSDAMQSLTLAVGSIYTDDGFGRLLTGTTEDGRQLQARTAGERRLMRRRKPKRILGRVARVEFPRGHVFRVVANRLPDARVDAFESALEQQAQSVATNQTTEFYHDVHATTTHEGRAEYPDGDPESEGIVDYLDNKRQYEGEVEG